MAKEALPKFQGLGGIGILLILMWTAILGSLGLLFPAMALLLLPFEWSRRAFRAWSMLVATQWFVLATLLLEKWAGVRIIVSGDVPSQRGEPAMIICNHRTRIDWMFLWSLCYRLGILKSMKITLKDSLKSLPGFGWAMQCFLFVFLARDKCKDLQHMQEIIDYHTQNNHPVSLILFPEGTDLSSRNLMESNAYASRKGLQKYRHVLHPKVVGWSRSVSLLRHTCRYVYDVTIAYKDFMPGERPSELSILTARYPKEVHIHMDRYTTSSLPDAPADLENWCRARFAAKEKLLSMFYGENGGSLGAEASCPVSVSERVGCWKTAVIFWSAMTVTSLFSLVIIIGWFWLFWALVAWILITRWGGVDALELRLHGSRGVFKRMLTSRTSSG